MRRLSVCALLGALIALTIPAARPALAADDHTLVWLDALDVNVLKPLTSADIAFSVALINDPKTNIADRTGYDLIT